MHRQDIVFSFTQLKEYLTEKGVDRDSVSLPVKEKHAHTFSLQIPKYYLDLIDWTDPDDPLRKMVIPSEWEETTHSYELSDPIGDHIHSPVPGIVHRYPDRCLLMLTNFCAVHCRFCFRRNLLSTNTADYAQAFDYLREHTELWEVILSGGDPFMLTEAMLSHMIDELQRIKHIKVVRFHTRTPAVYPAQITQHLLTQLKRLQKPVVVVHINHPREITSEFVRGIERLHTAGSMLLSQTVLMRGVNNDVSTLTKLFKRLVEVGVKPYYLHHLDVAAGTHHFRISIDEGKQLVAQLRGNISGICIPEYVLDIPGGYGKIPVFWFQHVSPREYQATSFEGKEILYLDHFYE